MDSRIVYNRGNTAIASTKWRAMVVFSFMMVGSIVGKFNFLHGIVFWNINTRDCGENQNINGQYECNIFHFNNLMQIYIKKTCNWVAKFLFIAIGTNTFHNHIDCSEFKIHR